MSAESQITAGIRLKRISESRTRVTYGALDPSAARALHLLQRASVGSRCNWATSKDWATAEDEGIEIGLRTSRSIVLDGPITAVARLLRRQLQPKESMLSQVLVVDGTIQDCYESSYDTSEETEEEEEEQPSSATWRPLIE